MKMFIALPREVKCGIYLIQRSQPEADILVEKRYAEGKLLSVSKYHENNGNFKEIVKLTMAHDSGRNCEPFERLDIYSVDPMTFSTSFVSNRETIVERYMHNGVVDSVAELRQKMVNGTPTVVVERQFYVV